MSSGPETFLKYLTIITFAVGIVALGAVELHRRLGVKQATGAKPGQLVRELHGEVDMKKASLAHAKNAGRQPEVQDRQPSGADEQTSSDELSSNDRTSLGALIDDLIP